LPVALTALLVAACSEPPRRISESSEQPGTAQTPVSEPHSQAPELIPADELSGTVVETMNSGGYTYVLLDDGEQEVWAAGPQTYVAVGDTVSLSASMPMANFYSSTLERDFDLIFFAAAITGGSAPGGSPNAAPETPDAPAIDASKIEQVEGGQTVEGIFVGKHDLVGKTVSVRGKVVKFTPAIMGKNWLHIQDGTGAKGTNDLTVTTDASAAVGDTVVISGVLVADKDFGAGYRYDLIIEDAQVTVE